MVASVHTIQAQAAVDDAAISFDIPAQPLEAALEAFGERSRLQVLYETALTAGRRSSEVKGIFTRSTALRRLLSGTGLEFNYTGELAFTLVPARTTDPTKSIAAFNRFLGSVQASVLAALCQSPETRPGAFRLAMQFWIGSAGRIENPRLLNSTGVNGRDAAITDALKRVAFGQTAPSEMPQPITMVLKAGPADARDECGP
ncbi:STN domain-containing protein [Bradyrhizobium sp. LHD-71]|uniref:STN domain-containing protein n=1 Tax=Bradyrhizobium sp. LHD-71 TaxID=3072141 RepID=UPI00280D3552|nr:STN domain-containing protein [Bradyrhizobium sp. LHD-71]MDQ8727920.1 STN domain-containing protein [Bradyrhizobium sp. LHD-71]